MTDTVNHLGYFPFCIKNLQDNPSPYFRFRVPLKAAMYLFWKAKTIKVVANVSHTQIWQPDIFEPDVVLEQESFSINRTVNFVPNNTLMRQNVCKQKMECSFVQDITYFSETFNFSLTSPLSFFLTLFEEPNPLLLPPGNRPKILSEQQTISGNDDVDICMFLNVGMQMNYTRYAMENSNALLAGALLADNINVKIDGEQFLMQANASVTFLGSPSISLSQNWSFEIE
jgi:hypothetical protein